MPRLLSFALLILLGALSHAAEAPPAALATKPPPPRKPPETITVKVGNADIKLSPPDGMVDVPKDDRLAKALEKLTPPDCAMLRSCISAGWQDPDHEDDGKVSENPDDDIMNTDVYYLKEQTMDIDSGIFIDVVQRIANDSAHGVLISQYSGFDYDDVQKRFDAFAKETGLGIKQDGDVYSLGMVSRSYACVSYMAAQYLIMSYKEESRRVKCVSVVGYLRLNKKVVITITSLTRGTVVQGDIRALKHRAEKYQLDLQMLNNPSAN